MPAELALGEPATYREGDLATLPAGRHPTRTNPVPEHIHAGSKLFSRHWLPARVSTPGRPMAPGRCCHDRTAGCREQRRTALAPLPAEGTAIMPLKIMTSGYADPSFSRNGEQAETRPCHVTRSRVNTTR